MNISEFNYHLPKELIAHKKSKHSRLLVYKKHSKEIIITDFDELARTLLPTDHLVFNNTKVIPARLKATKQTGGAVEIFIERILSDDEAVVMVRSNSKLKLPLDLNLNEHGAVSVTHQLTDQLFKASFSLGAPLLEYLNQYGRTPTPPYIKNPLDQKIDYQTVFAQHAGSCAAPTAGLHFTKKMMEQLHCQKSFITLHVGLGTFNPVRSEDIEIHMMHHERFHVSEEAAQQLNHVQRPNQRVIAVGTTSARTLESVYLNNRYQAKEDETNLFIYPGYQFKAIDGLLTNFHLPKSTLFMLVCAMIGTENAHRCYKKAIDNQMRFFSYGDAMLIL